MMHISGTDNQYRGLRDLYGVIVNSNAFFWPGCPLFFFDEPLCQHNLVTDSAAKAPSASGGPTSNGAEPTTSN
jgi:hypothetical protein